MTKKTNSVVEAILEMADDQLRSGLIDKAEHEKITIRHMGVRGLGMSMPIGKPKEQPPIRPIGARIVTRVSNSSRTRSTSRRRPSMTLMKRKSRL